MKTWWYKRRFYWFECRYHTIKTDTKYRNVFLVFYKKRFSSLEGFLLEKMGMFFFFLKERLEWKIKDFLNVLLINWRGIIFHSWNESSYSPFIHEDWRLVIFSQISTSFNPSSLQSLQDVSYLIFGDEFAHKKLFCIFSSSVTT